jgi:hypothetical protein
MMGSDADGEALNAARLADRLVRACGVTWLDVVALGVPAAAKTPKTRKSETTKQPKTWRDLCRTVALDKMAPAADRAFCRELLGNFRGCELSRRQIETLKDILSRRRERAKRRAA